MIIVDYLSVKAMSANFTFTNDDKILDNSELGKTWILAGKDVIPEMLEATV